MEAEDSGDSSSDSFASDDEGELLGHDQEGSDDDQDAEDSSETESTASGDELEELDTFEDGAHNSDDEVSNSPSARSCANTLERESTDDCKSDAGLERTASQKALAGAKSGKLLRKKGSKTNLVGGKRKGEGKLGTTTIDFSLQVDVRKDPSRPKPTKDKALLYRLTSGGQYNCIRHAFKRAGFYATSGNHFNVMWGKPLKNPQFKQLNDFQKVNHFPGMYLLGRKDNLARACNRFRRTFGPDAFPYLPKTFVLPADRAELLADYEEQRRVDPNAMYIVKPPASCKGIGIRLVSDPSSQIKEKTVAVVSRYVSDPFLINGTKFDLRIYVVITSFQPLRIYVHEQGMARFCTVKYSSKTRKNRYRHLTNYSLNKQNPDFIKNAGTEQDALGHKWSLRAVMDWMAQQGLDPAPVQQRIDDLIVKTILAVEVQVHTLLLGFDVMLDQRLHPWLMEVNTGLSLATDSPLDKLLKNTVVTDLLHMIQVQGFDRRKLGESQAKDKTRRLQGKDRGGARSHADNVRRRDVCSGRSSALQDLNEEDAEVLMECEEELGRSGGYRRLFPNKDAGARGYLELLQAKRFCNALLWEWVSRDNAWSLQDYLEGRHQAQVKPKPLRRANTGPQLGGALLRGGGGEGGGSFRGRTASSDSYRNGGNRSMLSSPRGRAGEEDGEEGLDCRAPSTPHSSGASPPRVLLSPDGAGAWGRRSAQAQAEGMRVLLDSMAAGLRGSGAGREGGAVGVAGSGRGSRERGREGLFATARVRGSLQVGSRKGRGGSEARRSGGLEGGEKTLPPLRALQQQQGGSLLAVLHPTATATSILEAGRCRSPGAAAKVGLRRGVDGVPLDGAAG